MSVKPKRTITKEEKEMLMSLKPDDVNLTLLQNLFANRYDPKTRKIIQSQFETYDEFTLEAGEYFNTEKIITNCGLFIFNKYLIEPDFKQYLGYINFPINKKGFGKIESIMADVVLEDDSGTIVERYMTYLDRLCWLAFTFHTEICASKTLKSCKPLPKVQAAKKKMLKERKQAIDEKNLPEIVKMSEDLIKIAKEELKDDPSIELYDSGARGAFDNAYRQAQVMKGPIYNASQGEWHIMTNSLYEGATKEDIPSMANAIVSGVYPKSIGTGECGYLTKQLMAAFQSNVLDEPGTDCKTKLPVKVTLTDSNKTFYYYHYIVEGDKFVRFDPKTESKYIGKTVQMRLPGTCIGNKLCARCAGDRYYLMGIRTIGLTNGRLSNSMLRGRMKQAHDATVRLYNIRLDELVASV